MGDGNDVAANVRLVHELVAAWNAHDAERVKTCYAQNYEGTDVAEIEPHRGPDDVRRHMRVNLRAFPDLELHIERCVAQEDCVALFWHAHGTQTGKVMNIPATGRRVEVRGVSLFKIAEGKIVQGTRLWDVAGMLRTIGLLPDLGG
jgi:steroid delta-isomerase-like uncharacterized protein